MISLSSKNIAGLNFCYVSCLITQVCFITFEFAQLKEQRLAYFKDLWNLLDSSQFAVFVLLFMIKMPSQFSTDTFPEIILQSVLLFQSFNKLFYFIRIYENINFIFTMAFLMVREIIPFLGLVMVLMLAYCKLYTLQHMSTNDPQFDTIQSPMLRYFIQTYKSNRGDVNVPALDDEMNKRVNESLFYNFMLSGLNLTVWVSQQCIFLLFGAMFTIQVLQAYERHYASMEKRMYRTKAQLNSESFDILDIFFKQNNFKVVCFAMDKQLRLKKEFQWRGVSNYINKGIMEKNYENEI